MKTKKSPHFPSRLRPASAVILSLFAGAGAWAATPGAGSTLVAEVEFNDTFLQQPGAGKIDISRFNKGNPALAGDYRADLYANQMWLGRGEVKLRQVGGDPRNVQPCFNRALLERIGVDLDKLQPGAAERLENENACAPLPELVKDATASFDNSEQRLDITVPQIAMSRQARGYVDPKYWDDGVTAARLQYNANVYHTDMQGASSTQSYLGLNAGFNVGAWRFRHLGNLTHNEQVGTHYQSVQTSLQRAITPLKSQFTIGDAFTEGIMFDSVGFRGVQLSTDDRMLPESQRGYAPTIHGIANSNARVQIRQNGNIIYETTVAPGAFEINDLYPTGYGGDLEVIVTEADGSVHVSGTPYAAAVNSLRPGVTRYSVTAGQYRNTSVHRHPILLQATMQHGFNNLITGYGGFTAAENYWSAVAGVALNTDYGAFGADVTHASTRLANSVTRDGQSARLSYSKLLTPTNTNLTLAAYRYSSSGFLSLADAVALMDLEDRGLAFAMNGIQRGRLQVTINQALPRGYGSFYLTGSTQDYWNRGGRDTQFQAGYNNSYRRLNYGVSASRQFNITTGRWDTRVMFTVGIPLGTGPHAPYSMTSLSHDTRGGTAVQESVTGALGVDNAFTYGLNAGYTTGGDAASAGSIGVNAGYISPVATLTGSASTGRNYTQASLGISGGMVAYAGGVAFTPTIGDTMAIVEARDAAGARVANASGLRVDPWGHAIVPTLTPFASNQVEIDPKGLPMSVELKSTQQHIAPTAGAIVRMKFETANPGRAAILRATGADGKALPFGAEVTDAQGNTVGTVAQGGRIIVRGLKNDEGQLTVTWGKQASETCGLDYALPKADPKAPVQYQIMDAGCR
ncbi:fimbria/pilus outer membrane usher protein [Cupriavidus necator]|uniref:fimbria/pilus outer membrane usher protein n=1 Tax=Cupriavidus necator TaxID=106590 RepID=UPI00339D7BB3